MFQFKFIFLAITLISCVFFSACKAPNTRAFFQLNPPGDTGPSLISILPTTGATSGGTALTLTGTNFEASDTVSVGGNPCVPVTFVSSTELTCFTPPGILGPVNVAVKNVQNQASSLANAFTYESTNVAPQISGISPNSGPLTGGTTVTISGTGFTLGATATIGTLPCTSPTVISSTSFTCVSAPNSAGAYNVTITNPDSQFATQLSAFNYEPAPLITSLTPNAGPLAGGTTITIHGSGFFPGAIVSVGGSSCSSPAIGASAIICTTPPGALGAADVIVTNTDGQSVTNHGGYLYQGPPTVASISPIGGPMSGNTSVTVTGTGYLSGATVLIGGAPCANVLVVSLTQITCVTPPHAAGATNVTVTNSDSQSGTKLAAFTYEAAPVPLTVSPTAGALGGGTLITIGGTGFIAGATVTVNNASCTSPSVTSATSMNCLTPANAAGTYDIKVINPDTQSGIFSSAYTYQAAPAITTVTPSAGPLAGGNSISLAGTGFLAGATVTIGAVACTSPTVVSATQITCTTPAEAAGAKNVVVTNWDNQTGTKVNGYTFEGAPTVTTITPAAGALGGGTSVSLVGTGFLPGITVTVGTVSCTGVSVISQTHLTCTTGAHTAGTADVQVTNADTQTGSLTSAYTFQAAPTITSVSPTAGALAGGTTLTLTGTGYLAGATVKVGNTTCTSPTIVSSTSVTCVTPAHTTGSYDVTITNSDTQLATLLAGYTYEPAPTLTTIALTSGPLTGGSLVTLTGTGFLSGAGVAIGGNSCTGVTVVSTTQITCSTPSGTAGAKNVVVTNFDSQLATLTNGYLYQGPPTVTSLVPAGGALAGGTSLTVNGSNFLTGATVIVGGAACTSPTLVSSSQITCTTAAHAAASVDVTVTNTDTQFSTLTNGYTYEPAPTITSLTPAAGAPAGGTTITLTGTGFIAGASVKIGGTTCTSPSVLSTTQISCVTPAHVAATYTVAVTNFDNQSGSLASAYTYQAAPTVSSINPTSGPAIGGTAVTITGTGFLTGATVTIAGVTCTSPNVLSATQVSCTTGVATAGVSNVVVTNSDTQSGTGTGIYTYVSAPTITSVSPSAGALAGGTSVLVNGTGFISGATVSFGGTGCTAVTLVSSSQISCTTPAHAAAAVTVSVTNPDTQSGSLASAYTYEIAPTVTSVSPVAGAVIGGTNLTISGTGFISGATVSIGGANCSSVLVASLTSLTCTTTAKAPGTYNIVVTNPDTQSGTLNSAYTYQSAPSVTSISPGAGALGGGTAVTITGTAFSTGATVAIGTSACTVTLATATSIMCTTTVGTAGAKDVVVTNPDSQTGTLTNGYTYEPAPAITLVTPNAGALAGGTSVTLSGTGFLAGATVNFDTGTCGTVMVVSSTSLTCTTPAHAAGAVSIVVTNTDTQFGTLSSGYTYQPAPTLTSSSPPAGALAGGTTLTLVGTGLMAGGTVTVGTNPCTSLNVTSSTGATCSTPANPAGTYNVKFANADGQFATLTNAYVYEAAPHITSITPQAGTLAGNTAVSIVGTGFLSGVTVTVGGNACTGITMTPTLITCNTPAGAAGPVDLVVTNVDTQSATLTNGFTYQPAPTLTSFTPTAGALAGGTAITVTGTGFVSGANVSFGGANCTSVIVVSPTSITCTTAAHAAGVVNVQVANADTQTSNTLMASYTYQSGPMLTSISPTAGALAGGTTVTLTGTSFLTGAVIKVGTVACTASNFISATSLTCTTPSQAAGTYGITVTNPDSQLSTLSSAYTYEAAPTLSAISPVNGFLYGNYNLTITGTGFLAGATVNLGATPCNAVTIVSSSQITCTAPTVLSAGAVNVTVANSDMQNGVLTNGFTYNIDGFTRMDLVDGPMGNANTNATSTNVRMSDVLYSITSDGTNLYVADAGFCTIRKVVIATQVATTLAGTPGNCVSPGSIVDNSGASAAFAAPNSIVYDGSSYLYVGDAYTIRRVDPSSGAVTTVAGLAGTGGTTDAVGSNARFGPAIFGLTTDGVNLYIADTNNHTIRTAVLSNFSVSTIAGAAGSTGNNNASGTSATFNHPHGLTTDLANVYVADAGNNLIRKLVIGTQAVTTYAGSGTAAETDGTGTAASFNVPYGIFIMPNGTSIYVIDYGGGVIRKINAGTAAVTTISSQNAATRNDIGTAAFFAGPLGITGDNTNLYVTDRALAAIRKIKISTNLTTTGAGQINQYGLSNGSGSAVQFYNLYAPTLVAATPMLYAPDQINCQIRAVDPTNATTSLYAGNSAGTCSTTVGHGSGPDAYFWNPQAITNDGLNLYVADGRTIRAIDLETSFVSVLTGQLGSSGAADGNAATSLFGGSTYGIVYDGGSNVYVSDLANHAIRQVNTTSGAVTTLAGTLGSSGAVDASGTSASFNRPMGLAISSDNSKLYVADNGNCSVRQIVIASGAVTTLAGSSGVCGFVNNTGSSARFNLPTTLTGDGTNLYVYDSATNVIRRIVISTQVVSTFMLGQVNAVPYLADIDGAIGSANVDSPNGLYWSPYGFFVTNPYNIRRIH